MDEERNEATPMSALSKTLSSDQSLLEQLAGGQDRSFDVLFHRHYDRVYGLLFRLTGNRAEAEDLTQETFIRLHAYATAGRLQREDANVGAWLYRVAMNLGYNALRGRKRFWQRNVYLLTDGAGADGPENDVVRREERQLVRAVLAKLPERQAQLLLLRQMGFNYAECAAICHVAPGSVGTLLARAAGSFRRIYESMSAQQARGTMEERSDE